MQHCRAGCCDVPTGLARETADLKKLSMMHVYGDPLKYRDLKDRIAVEKFNSAIILCDAAWVDPDQVLHLDSCRGHQYSSHSLKCSY